MSLDFEKIVSDFAWDYFNKNANKKQVSRIVLIN